MPRINAIRLKKKYPLQWARVESAVKDDVRRILIGNMGRIRKAPTDEDIDTIAHNAAFVAVCLWKDALLPKTASK